MSKDEEIKVMNKLKSANDLTDMFNGITDKEDRKMIMTAFEGMLAGYNIAKGETNGV